MTDMDGAIDGVFLVLRNGITIAPEVIPPQFLYKKKVKSLRISDM